MGMPPGEPDVCKALVASSTLYLPISVPVRRRWSWPPRASLTFTLHDDLPLTTLRARTRDLGVHTNLYKASSSALQAMLDLMAAVLSPTLHFSQEHKVCSQVISNARSNGGMDHNWREPQPYSPDPVRDHIGRSCHVSQDPVSVHGHVLPSIAISNAGFVCSLHSPTRYRA